MAATWDNLLVTMALIKQYGAKTEYPDEESYTLTTAEFAKLQPETVDPAILDEMKVRADHEDYGYGMGIVMEGAGVLRYIYDEKYIDGMLLCTDHSGEAGKDFRPRKKVE